MDPALDPAFRQWFSRCQQKTSLKNAFGSSLFEV
jgi:hypothetical protein